MFYFGSSKLLQSNFTLRGNEIFDLSFESFIIIIIIIV